MTPITTLGKLGEYGEVDFLEPLGGLGIGLRTRQPGHRREGKGGRGKRRMTCGGGSWPLTLGLRV